MTTVNSRRAVALLVAIAALAVGGAGFFSGAHAAQPDPNGEGWVDLALRGARGVELVLEGDAEVRVFLVRESTGRVRARYKSAGEPGVAAGEAGWETETVLETQRESGISYLTEPDLESPYHPEMEIELEVPVRLTLTIHGRRAEVSLTGAPQAIPMELAPFVQVPIEQRMGTRNPARAANAPASIPAEDPPITPVAKAYGGAISIQADEGSVVGIDLSNAVSIDMQHGDVNLVRVAGKVDIKTRDAGVTAEGIAGPMTITGGSTHTLRGLHHMLKVTGEIGLVDVRGVVGASNLKVSGGSVQAEDIRARFQASVRGGSLRMREIHYGAQVDLSGGDIEAVAIGGRIHIKAAQANVSVRDSNGSVMIRGAPDGVQIENTKGAVDVRTDRGDVSIRDVEGTVAVIAKEADVEIAGVTGQILVKSSGGWASIRGGVSRQIRVDADTVEVEFETPPAAGTSHTFNAASFARVVLPDGWYAISARATGEIESDFPIDTIPDEEAAKDEESDGAPGSQESVRPAGSRTRQPQRTVSRREPGKPGGGRLRITSGGDIEIINN